MGIVGLEGEEFIDMIIYFVFNELLSLVIYHTHLAHYFLHCYFMVLTKDISALLYEGAVGHLIIINIKYKKPQHEIQWLYQVLQIIPKFVYEEWLYDLIVEENALWKANL